MWNIIVDTVLLMIRNRAPEMSKLEPRIFTTTYIDDVLSKYGRKRVETVGGFKRVLGVWCRVCRGTFNDF